MGSKSPAAPRRCSILTAPPLCPLQGALSAGNNSTEMEGKPARPAMQAEPPLFFPRESQQRIMDWSEGWDQASSKLGRV